LWDLAGAFVAPAFFVVKTVVSGPLSVVRKSGIARPRRGLVMTTVKEILREGGLRLERRLFAPFSLRMTTD
jgi:hypothetical protein